MNKSLLVLLACLGPTLAFGALRRDAVIHNASGVEIAVHYLNEEINGRIKPGESKRIIYPSPGSLLPISFASRLYRFPSEYTPHAFMKVGMFKSTFKMVVGEDRRLYLIPFETPPAEAWAKARKQTQPRGWPVEGVEFVPAGS